MCQLRDISPVSGAIMWSKQIDQQLSHYMRKVEDVLGKGWELYADGQKLQAESAAFRKKLDTRPIFDAWLADITKKDLQIAGFVFSIQKNRLLAGQLQLAVNFDPSIIQLFKEVRNLLWLNFPVPHSITNLSSDAKWGYPHAVSLSEAVRLYGSTVATIQNSPEIAILVAGYHKNMQQLLHKGLKVKWEFFLNSVDLKSLKLDRRENRHVAYIRELSGGVSEFNEKVHLAVSSFDEIREFLQELDKCAFRRETFGEILDAIQKIVRVLELFML
jgi:dynein heavy chain 1